MKDNIRHEFEGNETMINQIIKCQSFVFHVNLSHFKARHPCSARPAGYVGRAGSTLGSQLNLRNLHVSASHNIISSILDVEGLERRTWDIFVYEHLSRTQQRTPRKFDR